MIDRCELCGEKAAILIIGKCMDCWDWEDYFSEFPIKKIRTVTVEDMKGNHVGYL